MLSKDQRINQKEDFQKIYKNGQIYNLPHFQAFILKNKLKKSRATVIISKKVSPSAVHRNKIKRRFRHILAPLLSENLLNTDVLIVVKNLDILNVKNSELKYILQSLGKK